MLFHGITLLLTPLFNTLSVLDDVPKIDLEDPDILKDFNAFMHNIVKWPNILQNSYGANTARFLKYVWPIYNMHERVNKILFIGVMTKQYARGNDIETSEYKKFLKEVRAVLSLNVQSTCKHKCQCQKMMLLSLWHFLTYLKDTKKLRQMN